MEHLILTRTEFFRQINSNGNSTGMDAAYNDFIMAVISLCTEISPSCHPFLALSYTETELQHYRLLHDTDCVIGIYVRKALSFMRKMLKHLAVNHIQVPPLIPIHASTDNTTGNPASPLQWTGNAIDLVELIYGINEMGCINNGEMPLKQLAPLLYKIFGVESKDCYRFYTDIKRRKNESRTYFLDRMQEKLNEKMLRDEEMERMRR